MPTRTALRDPGRHLHLDPVMEIAEAAVQTAGVYLLHDGAVVFSVGPDRTGDRLGIARLGGHREQGESPVDCALREVREEAGIRASPLAATTSYRAPYVPPGGEDFRLIPEVFAGFGAVAPLLVSHIATQPEGPFSIMFWGRVEGGDLTPGEECRGLLLLRPPEVVRLMVRPTTLRAHLAGGGRAILTAGFPIDLPLRPLNQLHYLARLLARSMVTLPAT